MRKVALFSLLWGLAMLLAGCEKEGLLGDSGEKVKVNILLGDIVYNGNETVTRGYADMAEAVRVPLGDGVYMFATLEEDVETPARAGIPLDEGVKVRVVAYDGSTIESTTEYTVTGGALVTATALEVNTGTTYTFVAYSYNNDTSPDYPASPDTEITVAPPHDLLWASASKYIASADDNVTITMEHQFAQVRVKATTALVSGQPIIKNMFGVTVTPGHSVDLTILTGDVEENATVTQNVLTWNNLNSITVTSDPITVYTGTANPIFVNIGSVTINGYNPFTNAQAEFKKALVAGYSYTLVVNFQKTLWAKSNVYWKWNNSDDHTQGGYMTFDTEDNGHEGYQGLLFKFGTLVGISPVGNWVNGSTPIYKAGESMPSTYPSWSSFPNGTIPPESFVFGYDLNSLTGDICSYINSDYRLPTVDTEYRANSAGWNQKGWVRVDGYYASVTTSETDGTYDFIANGSWYAKNTEMGVCFPPSGWRLADGTISDVGIYGWFWTSRRGSPTFDAFRIYSVDSMRGGSLSGQVCFARCIHN